MNRYNKEDICEACREQELDGQVGGRSQQERSSPRRADKPALHAPPEEGVRLLPSAADEEVRRLKYGMVTSLCVRRGPFWELVEMVRERWGIQAPVRVPPPDHEIRFDPEFPLRAPNRYLPAGMPDPYDRPDAHDEVLSRWHAELGRIYYLTVPEESPARGTLWDWEPFLAVCVLNDPPGDRLLEFVSVAGPEPYAYYGDRDPEDFGPTDPPRMLVPPIKTLQELRESPDWARDRVLYWLGEILDASGLDLGELLPLIDESDPGARERYEEEKERASRRHFIEVTDATNWEHLENAFSAYRAAQEGRTASGSPRRDSLLALQCAILHERHGKTYKELTDTYGFGSVDTAKRHVKLGSKILSGE